MTDAGYHSDEDDFQYDEDLQAYEMEDLYDGMEGDFEDEEEELKAALQRQGSDIFSFDDQETSLDTELYEGQDIYEDVDEQLLDQEEGIESIMLGGPGEEEESDAFVVPPLEDGDFSSDDEECEGGRPEWGPRAFKPVFVARTGRKFTLPKTAAKAPPKVVKQEDDVPKQSREKEEKENASTNEEQTKQETKSESVVEPGEGADASTKATEVQEAPIIGKCAADKCVRESRVIRDTDDRVEVRCSLKRPCVVWYHLKCWRLYDKATGITASIDKNHVRCVTPDCEGFIRTVRRFTKRSGDIKEHVSEFRRSDYIDPVVTHNEGSEPSGTSATTQTSGEANTVSGSKKGKKKPDLDTKKDGSEITATAKPTTQTPPTADKQKEKKGSCETTETVHTSGTSGSDPFVDACTRKDKKKQKPTKKQNSDVNPGTSVNGGTTANGQNATRTTTRINFAQETKHSPSKPQTQPREIHAEHIVPLRQEQTKSGGSSKTGKNAVVQSGNMWESKTSLQQLKASLRGDSSETGQSDSHQVALTISESCPKDDGEASSESNLQTSPTAKTERSTAFVTSSPPRQPTPNIVRTTSSTKAVQVDVPTKTNEEGPKFVVSAPAFVPRVANLNETSPSTQKKHAWTSASTPFLPGRSSTPTPPKVSHFYVVPFPTVSPRRVVHVHSSLLGWPFSDEASSERTLEKGEDDSDTSATSEEVEMQFTALSRVLAHIVDELVGKESPTITVTSGSFPFLKVRQVSTATQPFPPLSTDFPPLGSSPTPPSPFPSFHVSSSWSPQQQQSHK